MASWQILQPFQRSLQQLELYIPNIKSVDVPLAASEACHAAHLMQARKRTSKGKLLLQASQVRAGHSGGARGKDGSHPSPAHHISAQARVCNMEVDAGITRAGTGFYHS